MTLTVYSGKVALCETGLPTGAVDYAEKPLFTGDIVAIYTNDALSRPMLTVVIDEGDGPFVMGLKSVPMDSPSEWNIWKLKDHADCLDGEHWPAWGFRYAKAGEP